MYESATALAYISGDVRITDAPSKLVENWSSRKASWPVLRDGLRGPSLRKQQGVFRGAPTCGFAGVSARAGGRAWREARIDADECDRPARDHDKKVSPCRTVARA